MGLLDRHLTEIAEKLMEHIDLEEVTAEVLSKLTVTDLEMYFVVRYPQGTEEPEFVGLAYSKSAAGNLWIEGSKGSPQKVQILKLNMAKAMELAVQAGVVDVVEER